VIRHIALLTFTEGTTDAQVQAIVDALSTLPAQIPQLQSYSIGRDLGLGEGNASFAVVADCATVDDFIEYRDNPEHRRVVADFIDPVLTARTAVQYELP
jgi:hypothetical protein